MARGSSKADPAKAEQAARDLKERLGKLASKLEGVSPKNMFGYPYFFHQGNAVAGLMGSNALFYLDAEASAEFLTMPSTRPWMRDGRLPEPGWHVLVDAAAHEDAVLEDWLNRAVSYVATLPPKVSKRQAKRP